MKLRTSPWLLVARWLLLSLTLQTAAAPALAAPPRRAESDAESSEYRQAIRSALDEFDAGNFPEARAAFTRAHALSPNARTFRGLGFVAFELRKYVQAVQYLESALDSTEKPLDGELRRTTEQLLTRAHALLARVSIEASPGFDAVLVDGFPAQLEDGHTLVLEVGDHAIELRGHGLVSERRALEIAGGERLTLSFTLRPAEPSAAPSGPRLEQAASTSAPVPQDDPGKRRWHKSPWLWSALAVVVVGAGVGTYFALRPDSRVEPEDPITTANTPPGGVLQMQRGF